MRVVGIKTVHFHQRLLQKLLLLTKMAAGRGGKRDCCLRACFRHVARGLTTEIDNKGRGCKGYCWITSRRGVLKYRGKARVRFGSAAWTCQAAHQPSMRWRSSQLDGDGSVVVCSCGLHCEWIRARKGGNVVHAKL